MSFPRTLTLVVATVLAATACSPAQQAEGPATPTATAPEDAGESTPTPTPTPTASPQAEDVAVVVDTDGRVRVIEAATGEQVRELLDGVRVDDPAANDLAVSPDRDHVFVVAPPDQPGGTSEILRIPVDGGDPESIAEGSAPAVSPDGTTLAYITYEERTDAPGAPEPFLVLQDVDSGERTRLAREEPFHFIPDVEWTTDGSGLVFTAGEIHTGLYAVDRGADSLDEARRLGPDLDDDPATTSWGPVAAFGEDRLAVVETCCDVPREERWHLVEVDLAEGAVTSDLRDERLEVTHLDSDAGADALLMVEGGGPQGGVLLRWDGAAEPERIADDVIVAAW